MNTQLNHRPQWDVDRILAQLLGDYVRVAAKSFSLRSLHDAAPLRFIPVRDLYLPDNSQPVGLLVFFEGKLLEFERQIGVVFVRLDAPALVTDSPDGTVFFRGKAAVILRGPAVLELAFPFHVEKLPDDPDNYWRDLRMPCAQFEFPISPDKMADERPSAVASKKSTAMISRGYAGGID